MFDGERADRSLCECYSCIVNNESEKMLKQKIRVVLVKNQKERLKNGY